MVRAHIIVSGFVQGVGFRYFLKRKADELGLVGWTRNTPNGNVEVVIEGPQEGIDLMIAYCKKGPYLAGVDSVKVVLSEARREFTEFIVAHD